MTRWIVLILLVTISCVARPPGPTVGESSKPQEERARSALGRFVASTEAGDFETAFSLLAGPLRARYSVARLREDFQRDPLARQRLERLRRALNRRSAVDEEGASFPVEGGGAARLVREEGEYRIASIE